MDKDKLVDEQRRNAITAWWERMALSEYIAMKRADARAALRSHAQPK